MNILVYHRPIHKEFYENLATRCFPGSKVLTVSDFRNSADIWLGEYMFDENIKQVSLFSEEEKNEIFLRCRFLRSINKNRAYKLIERMSAAINNILAKHEPNLIIGAVIDNYTMDIIERLSKREHIPYISFLGHFFSGYSWITKRGELNLMPRQVSDSEVNDVLNKIIDKRYIPNYHLNLKPTIINAYRFYLKQMIKKYLYLPAKRIYERDRWNYYYNTYFFEKSNLRRINDYVNGQIEKYFVKNDQLGYCEKQVLLPLHFTPEATTDYWCDDPKCGAYYEESVIDVIKKSSCNVLFLVKEHPVMFMKRKRQFYEKLLSFKNVMIIHPLENSNESLEKVDTVYVYTGSIGVEALLREKRVISKSKNYYSNLHPNVTISDYVSGEHLTTKINKYSNKKFIKDILQGTIQGNMFNDKNIMKSDIEKLFTQIRDYYNSLGEIQ